MRAVEDARPYDIIVIAGLTRNLRDAQGRIPYEHRKIMVFVGAAHWAARYAGFFDTLRREQSPRPTIPIGFRRGELCSPVSSQWDAQGATPPHNKFRRNDISKSLFLG